MDHQPYLTTIILIERLHRQFLDVVKVELERQGIADINNVQALILHNIGDEELTVGELTHRGYYLGSNVSYNVKKMVENAYLKQERSAHDRRSIRVRLSDKGLALRDKITKMYEHHVTLLGPDSALTKEDVQSTIEGLRKLERFWGNILEYGVRGPHSPFSSLNVA